MNPQRIIALLTLVVAVAGAGISAYLTSVHYAHVDLVCTSNGLINCEQVLESSYSEVLGIPWSVGGIAWFAGSGGLALAILLRDPEPPLLHPVQVTWSLLGARRRDLSRRRRIRRAGPCVPVVCVDARAHRRDAAAPAGADASRERWCSRDSHRDDGASPQPAVGWR